MSRCSTGVLNAILGPFHIGDRAAAAQHVLVSSLMDAMDTVVTSLPDMLPTAEGGTLPSVAQVCFVKR